MRNSPNFSLADEVVVRALEAGACSTAAPTGGSPSTTTLR